MGSQRDRVPSKAASNKIKRQSSYIQSKKIGGAQKRAERFRRRKEEQQDPELRRARLEKNKPITIESKRVWDDGDDDSLGAVVDLAALRRRRAEEEAGLDHEEETRDEDEDEDMDSMLGSDDDVADEEDEEAAGRLDTIRMRRAQRDDSVAPSTTSTNLDLTPAALARKFPNLFSDESPPAPKVLVTTSLRSTIHTEAEMITALFPNSTYIPRTGHRYGYKYSLREICRFASNRDYTAVVLIKEDQKKPTGLLVTHLPAGPTLTYSISSWLPGKAIPGHGRATNHYPELLLNNFKTPLGLLVARSFQTLFPPQPEIQGRQVLSLSNSRDFVFVRFHRYVFREKRATEKKVVGVDGKEIDLDIRAALQELGPRFTMKCRRVDKGIGRAGSEGEDALSWEWKASMDVQRTRFNL